MIRVIVADDHHLVRAGIRALLEKANDIEVIGEAENGSEAVTLVESLSPDVLIMDINMPHLNGIEAAKQICSLKTDTQIVILSMVSDEIVVRQVLQNGAKGYLLKGSLTEELHLAVRATNQGATYLSPAISETIMADLLGSKPISEEPDQPHELTPREHELLQLISKGHTNSAIAELMHVSIKTVERHRTNLMTKLNARNIVTLIRTAIKHGLIQLDE